VIQVAIPAARQLQLAARHAADVMQVATMDVQQPRAVTNQHVELRLVADAQPSQVVDVNRRLAVVAVCCPNCFGITILADAADAANPPAVLPRRVVATMDVLRLPPVVLLRHVVATTDVLRLPPVVLPRHMVATTVVQPRQAADAHRLVAVTLAVACLPSFSVIVRTALTAASQLVVLQAAATAVVQPHQLADVQLPHAVHQLL
jgi:hypothetical protein